MVLADADRECERETRGAQYWDGLYAQKGGDIQRATPLVDEVEIV